MMQMLKKLWFGEYSLSKSYWFFGNIIPLIFFICLILFALFCQNDPLDSLLNLKFVPPEFYQKSIILLFCLIFLIYTVISTIGIWRSANKHTGKKHWGILAKITIFFAIFSYAKDIYKFFF